MQVGLAQGLTTSECSGNCPSGQYSDVAGIDEYGDVNYAPQDTEDGNAHGNVLPGEDSGALKALMENLTKIRMPTWTAKESLKDLRRLHSTMYTHH
eukprot:CAMPEP_0185795234 /NCGR_PEP_ID=MMETSP1174-20130828/160443_1 /TAXON_ID=35687 /ORGANISM="Dictyocha speculum, Strain CCMP1381" /LENGTH=95 /DNA_ID=CAMNT_0028490521 /DNA_START=621 /DNA_END=909 /DNA_ORIENTATION=+